MPSLDRTLNRLDLDDISIAFEKSGPDDGQPIILLHGFPDDVRAWDAITPGLVAAGYRTIAPWLRGYGPTHLKQPAAESDGYLAALTDDLIRLIDRLGIAAPIVVGHDWGGRVAQATAAIEPDRISRLVSLSRYAIAFGGGSKEPPPYDTLQALWYQWLLNLELGETILGADPIGFCRALWDQWSPEWSFDPADFERCAESFTNPDFVRVVLSFYREAYRPADQVPHRAAISVRLASRPPVLVPTQVLLGSADGVDLLETVTDESDLFPAGYRRTIVEGAGHFIHRERPDVVLDAIINPETSGDVPH